MIVHSIDKCFKTAIERNWDKVFWAVDIHETIIIPNYSSTELPFDWYPYAQEALQTR